MIRSFGNKDTERLWRRDRVPSIDPRIHSTALRKLRQVGPPSHWTISGSRQATGTKR